MADNDGFFAHIKARLESQKLEPKIEQYHHTVDGIIFKRTVVYWLIALDKMMQSSLMSDAIAR